MQIYTFRVYPGGRTFDTSDVEKKGDTNRAFERAHTHAAIMAARTKRPHQVVKENDPRGGFAGFYGWDAGLLQKILRQGIASIYDFQSDQWVPLEEDLNGVETEIVSVA